MKGKIIIGFVLILLLSIGFIFISGDTENRFSRLGVSYFDGDYVITHYGMSGINVWLVDNGKVTSEPDKGYYHTRVRVGPGKKNAYLQLPIMNTVIEEYFGLGQLTGQQVEILVSKYGNEALQRN